MAEFSDIKKEAIAKSLELEIAMFPPIKGVELLNGVTIADFKSTVATVALLFRLNNRRPTRGEIVDAFGHAAGYKLDKIVNTKVFAQWMGKLGIDWERDNTGFGLTTRQAIVIETITNPHDKRSVAAKLKAANVTPAMYSRWLKNPTFNSFVNRFAEAALSNHLSSAHMSLLGQVDKGSMDALKYYYQLTGRFDPNSKTEREIRDVVLQVVDIVTRNVTDPGELNAIAGELYSVLDGAPKPKVIGGFNVNSFTTPMDFVAVGAVDEEPEDSEPLSLEKINANDGVARAEAVKTLMAAGYSLEQADSIIPREES